MPLPRVRQPMLATLIDAPFDDDAWSFEIKWDGIRALCAVEAGKIKLTSRTGHDLLPQFPQLEALRTAFRRLPVLVDGEICSLDRYGRSSFQRLQHRREHIAYVVFDALAVEGRDIRNRPLDERRKLLAAICKTNPRLIFSQEEIGEGKRLLAVAKRRKLEGVIGKRRDSVYQERRSRDWVKVKAVNEQEAIIVGWTDPQGSRKGFGALLMGLYEGERLVFVGKVGTGFDRATIADVLRRLKRIAAAKPPIADAAEHRLRAHWVRPQLVAEIRFGEWTRDGLMRQPVFLGLRFDKKPRECVREIPKRRR